MMIMMIISRLFSGHIYKPYDPFTSRLEEGSEEGQTSGKADETSTGQRDGRVTGSFQTALVGILGGFREGEGTEGLQNFPLGTGGRTD